MKENQLLLEFHVLSSQKETLLDIDCEVKGEMTLSDLLEIIFVNHELIRSGIQKLYVFLPGQELPVQLDSRQHGKTLESLGICNGTVIRVIYSE